MPSPIPYLSGMKRKKKGKTGSVKIDPEVLNEVKSHCKPKGVMVHFFMTEAAKEKLEREKIPALANTGAI